MQRSAGIGCEEPALPTIVPVTWAFRKLMAGRGLGRFQPTGSVPKCMIFLQLGVQKTPELEDETRYSVFDLGSDIFAVNARYGFMEDLDVRELLKDLRERDLLPYDISRCTIHAAEEHIIIDAGAPWLTRARGLFFKYFSQLAIPTFRYFGLGGDTNVSVVLVPIHVTAEGVNVVRLFDNDLAI
jgi:K+ transporter